MYKRFGKFKPTRGGQKIRSMYEMDSYICTILGPLSIVTRNANLSKDKNDDNVLQTMDRPS